MLHINGTEGGQVKNSSYEVEVEGSGLVKAGGRTESEVDGEKRLYMLRTCICIYLS